MEKKEIRMDENKDEKPEQRRSLTPEELDRVLGSFRSMLEAGVIENTQFGLEPIPEQSAKARKRSKKNPQ
jgi:hypothetical protein